MKHRNIWIGAIILIVVLLVGGIWLYDWVLGETEAASGSISAPTLVLETAAPMTELEVTDAPAETSVPTSTPPQDQAEPTQPSETVAVEGDLSAGLAIYQINQPESQVRFNIFEELRGAPKDVIGVSDQVAGQVAVDLNDLSTVQVGEFLINARTLATDDDRRNQAIRNRILFTDQYEFISFTPTEISGLSGSAAPGQSFNFQITGDLTIRDITQPVTFDVMVNVESAERLVGTASTTINRSDFNLVVPDVPFVANVGEQVTLEIDFVLTPQ